MQSDTETITLRRYQLKDRAWVEGANRQHYRDREGFNETFDPALSDALDWIDESIELNTSDYTIAEFNGCPMGCIFLSAESIDAGRIRLFYLDEAFRGRGIGRRLLLTTLEQARVIGFEKVRVSTFDLHREACALYESAGFAATVQPASGRFGKRMRQIDFEIQLSPLIQAPA